MMDKVPPPPPHIELLSESNNNSESSGCCYCITHVISYLDHDSLINASVSCVYLHNAVKEYSRQETTPKVTPGVSTASRSLPRKVVDDEVIMVEKENASLNSEPALVIPTVTDDTEKSELKEDNVEAVTVAQPISPLTQATFDTEEHQPSSRCILNEMNVLESCIPKMNTNNKNNRQRRILLLPKTVVPMASTPEREQGDVNNDSKSDRLVTTPLLISPRSVAYEQQQVDNSNNDDEDMERVHCGNETSTAASKQQDMEDPRTTTTSQQQSISTLDLHVQTDTFLTMVASSHYQHTTGDTDNVSYLTYNSSTVMEKEETMNTLSEEEGGSSSSSRDDTMTSDYDDEDDEIMQQVSLGSTSIDDESDYKSGVVSKPNISMMNDTRGNNKCSTTTAITNTIHLGQQPTPAFTNRNTNTKKLAFTRLDDLRRESSSMEEIPFDERPKHLVTTSGSSIYHSPLSTRNFDSGGIMNKNQSMSNGNTTTRLSSLDEIMTLNSNVGSSISSVDSGLIAVVPSSTAAAEEEEEEAAIMAKSDDISNSTDDSKSSTGYTSSDVDNIVSSSSTKTTPDVLAQFSDAALFGDPTQAVSDILSDLVATTKKTMSNLVLQHAGRRNEIDDSGPIKIGDKYYTHNEALHLWRKAKDKLHDKLGDVDGGTGNVKIDRASFFEKNSIFQEEEEEEANTKKNKDGSIVKKEDGEMTLNELITRYKMLEKKKSRSMDLDESTEAAANNIESKTMMATSLMPVNEEKVTTETTTADQFRGFDVDNETAETESETNCSGGSGSMMNSASLDMNSQATTRSGDESDGSGGGGGGVTDRNGSVRNNNNKKKKMLTKSNNNNNNETDSVAGKDSLPSHMGSAYGVEVTSGMSCKFTTGGGGGKSSSRMTPQGGGGNCEQSVLGSQYGTEVLFKPTNKKKKVITGRKSRTLASHNMSVKKTSIINKQSSSNNNTAVSVNVNTTSKQQQLKQGSSSSSSSSNQQKKDVGASPVTTKSTQHRFKLQKAKKPLLLSKLGMSKKVNVR